MDRKTKLSHFSNGFFFPSFEPIFDTLDSLFIENKPYAPADLINDPISLANPFSRISISIVHF